MIINLRPFNNNPDNVNIDIQSHKVSITGRSEKNGQTFRQSLCIFTEFCPAGRNQCGKSNKKENTGTNM